MILKKEVTNQQLFDLGFKYPTRDDYTDFYDCEIREVESNLIFEIGETGRSQTLFLLVDPTEGKERELNIVAVATYDNSFSSQSDIPLDDIIYDLITLNYIKKGRV